MLRDIITGTRARVSEFVSKVRVGGFTVVSTLKKNRSNTINSLVEGFRSSVLGGVDVGIYSQALEKTINAQRLTR